MLGRLFPNIRVHQKPDTGYAETLSNRYDGEWDYRDDWKPDSLPDPDMGWIRAIDKGQRQLRRQTVKVPILLMHSSASVNKGDPEDKYFHADAILNVDTISYYGLRLGSDITEVAFDAGCTTWPSLRKLSASICIRRCLSGSASRFPHKLQLNEVIHSFYQPPFKKNA